MLARPSPRKWTEDRGIGLVGMPLWVELSEVLGVIARSRFGDLVDAKDRVVGCDCFEVRGWRIVRDGKVLATTCCDLGPRLKNR
jgi:hypothetical protein